MFVVEEEKKWHPNVMTIHVVTRKVRYYIVGCYLPPDDLETLEYVKKAWEQRPLDAIPLLMGDINVNLDNPENKRDDIIAEQLLDNWCLKKSCNYFYRSVSKEHRGK